MPSVSDSSAAGKVARHARSTSPRLSFPAILGTLVLVAGAVTFGVLGPRMGQRGMRVRGIPATVLQDAVLGELLGEADGSGSSDLMHGGSRIDSDPEQAMIVATKHLEGTLGPAVEPPLLVDAGFELVGSRRLAILDVEAVRLDYRSTETGQLAVLIELADPLAFVHFDTLGRQLPLVPGTRIGEAIVLDAARGASVSIGMVMLGFEGRATVVVTVDPEVAAQIADLIESVDSTESDAVIQGVATILEGPLEPMTRS
jgi:hypothetical protein